MIYINGPRYMHIHFRDGHCCLWKDVNEGKGGKETTCTKFLYTKDSSFIFQLFVSQVLLCDTVHMDSSVLLSTSILDVILMILSLSCSGIHVNPWMFL